MSDQPDWYEEKQAELKEAQSGKARQQVMEELKTRSEHVFDPETAPKIEHIWEHRGIEHVCVSPSHPRHVAFDRH